MKRVALLLLAVAACRKAPAPAAGPPPAMEIDPQSVVMVTPGEIDDGPLVTGTLRPDVEATLRAEVSGTVLQAPPELGTRVKKGQLLVRFDASALEQAEQSARSALRSARTAEELAARDAERYGRLARAGAVAPRDAENAQRTLVQAKAAAADAQARVSSSRNTLDRARVVAPFDGVISARPVKAGDVVQPGTPLATVIDPSTMRLEAAVPAARIGEIAAGQRVSFSVTGYDRRFEGTIDRISPVTDPATGQVQVSAVLPNAAGTLIGGLHAEGRVLTRHATGLVAPLAVVDRRRLTPEVLRLVGGVVERVPVKLGLTDELNQRVQLVSGVAAGDLLLVGAAQELAPGTRVQVAEERASARR